MNLAFFRNDPVIIERWYLTPNEMKATFISFTLCIRMKFIPNTKSHNYLKMANYTQQANSN